VRIKRGPKLIGKNPTKDDKIEFDEYLRKRFSREITEEGPFKGFYVYWIDKENDKYFIIATPNVYDQNSEMKKYECNPLPESLL